MNGQTPIYLDYQASTPVDPRVMALVSEVMAEDFANPHSEDHVLGWRARARIETARLQVATAIGALPEEVVFTSGATEADNIAVLGAVTAAPQGRRRVLVSAFEHKAVLEAARAASARGFSVEEIPITDAGVVDLVALEATLREDVAVVSVMAVNNEIGTIQPIEEVARLAAAVGAFSHTDATQAPAAMPIDVLGWGVDAASLSSHKAYGPKGVGALYVSSAAPWRPQPVMFGGGQEGGLRPGTLPAPLCAGFGLAMEILGREGEAERARVTALRDHLAERLAAAHSAIKFTCLPGDGHPGCLHALLQGFDADDIVARLQPQLCVSTASACTSGVIGASHVLSALRLTESEARSGLRISLGRFTDNTDIERAVELLVEAMAGAESRAA